MPKLFPSFWIMLLMRFIARQSGCYLPWLWQSGCCLAGFGLASISILRNDLSYAACTNQEPDDRFVPDKPAPDKTAPDKTAIARLRWRQAEANLAAAMPILRAA
ncbi:hypothetical protein N8524_02370 [Candidatus Puniceispirillum sp.]|nr:hypothetical protein [Candidatus Puniceispirillum sp.]